MNIYSVCICVIVEQHIELIESKCVYVCTQWMLLTICRVELSLCVCSYLVATLSGACISNFSMCICVISLIGHPSDHYYHYCHLHYYTTVENDRFQWRLQSKLILLLHQQQQYWATTLSMSMIWATCLLILLLLLLLLGNKPSSSIRWRA